MLPLLIRLDNLEANTSNQHAFLRSPVRIGRNRMNDIALDLPFVSQWHAVVRFDENNTEYIDLGSTNGTLANGQRLARHQPIAVSGNVDLRIGHLRVYCWRGPAPPHLLQQTPKRAGFAVPKGDDAPKTVAIGDFVLAWLEMNYRFAVISTAKPADAS